MDLRRPSHVRFGVLGFACTLSLITYLDRVCIMRARLDIERDLGITPVQMGWVFSAFLLGYLLFEVPGGLMGDWWGSRRVLTRIVIWWSVFTTLTGCVGRFTLDSGYHLSLGGWSVPLLLNGLMVMLLVRFLFGAGEAGAYPNLTRVVKGWFPFRERAFAQGTIWMSARLGGALAPFIIGRLSALVGWRWAFATLGGVGIAWASAFFLWFRDRPEQMPSCNEAERDLIRSGSVPPTALALPKEGITAHRPTPEGIHTGPPPVVPESPPDADHGHAWPPLGQLVSSLTLWGLGLAAACVSFGWYFYPTWQPEYLREVFGIDYKDSEIITGLPFLCGAVGALLGGGLSDRLVRTTGSRRWGRSLLGVGGFTAAGLCVLASGFVRAPWQAVALLCLASLVNDLAIPVIWAVCADVGGRFAGTVAGIMNMLGGIGGVLSPALIPQAREALQVHYAPTECWGLIFAGLATSWFIGAAAWLVIDAGTPMFKANR
jgi:MFS family permease